MTQSLDKNKIDEIKADVEKKLKKYYSENHHPIIWNLRINKGFSLEEIVEYLTAEALKAQSTEQDYKEVLKDHDRLVGELDVIINGEDGAAKQASLCDIVGQMKDIFPKLIHDKDIFNKGYIRMILEFREVCEERDRYKEALEKITSIEEDYVNAFNIASGALTNPQTTKP